jgi:dTDP-6-deoxy-L-talose 4-dehydrogenase (NAD+)
MKVAVTGASGFIGRHLLPILIKNGHEVIAVVRDINKISNFDRDYRVVEHEIGYENNDIFKKLGSPDVLLHLAWGGLPNYKSLHHIDVELPTHYHFIKLMVESGVKHVAVIGTCFEYGMQSGELSEDVQTRPNNPYGYAKDALRKKLQFLQTENDFNFIWIRLFYMYGINQPDNTLFSQLRKAALRGDVMFNMSGGEQLRDYLHIDEVSNKIVVLACMKKDIGVVNVCSGGPISVRRLVERWIKKNEWDIELNLGYYSYPDYEPFEFWGNSDKCNQIIKLGV